MCRRVKEACSLEPHPGRGSYRGRLRHSPGALRPIRPPGLRFCETNPFLEPLPKTFSLDTPETRVKAIAPGFFVGEQNRALLLNEDGSVTARGKTIIDHTSAGRFGEPDNLINT